MLKIESEMKILMKYMFWLEETKSFVIIQKFFVGSRRTCTLIYVNIRVPLFFVLDILDRRRQDGRRSSSHVVR